MKNTMATVHKFLTGFISLGAILQMFLAGIWHAEVVSSPDAHVFFGLGLLLASLLALIAAAVARMPQRLIGMTALLFVLILLQPILIEQRRSGIAFLSAFHTLNAPFIGLVSGAVMRLGTQALPEPETAAAYQASTGD